MEKNDLTDLFYDSNLIVLEEIAPYFFLTGEEAKALPILQELIDYDLHLHLIGRGMVLKNILKERGFLFSRPTILGHEKIPEWVLKAHHPFSYKREDFDHLFRVVMAKKMREVIRVHELDLAVPQKRYVPAFFSSPWKKRQENYYVLSEKFDCMSMREMAEAFIAMPSKKIKKIAKDLATFIAFTGFQDIHGGNVKYRRDGTLSILDTEPWGILVEANDKEPLRRSHIYHSACKGLKNFHRAVPFYSPIDPSESGEKKMAEIRAIFEKARDEALFGLKMRWGFKE